MSKILRLSGVNFPVTNPKLVVDPLLYDSGVEFLFEWGSLICNPDQVSPQTGFSSTSFDGKSVDHYLMQGSNTRVYDPVSKSVRFLTPADSTVNTLTVNNPAGPFFERNATDSYVFIVWLKVDAAHPVITGVAGLSGVMGAGDAFNDMEFYICVRKSSSDGLPLRMVCGVGDSGGSKTISSPETEIEGLGVVQYAVVAAANQPITHYLNGEILPSVSTALSGLPAAKPYGFAPIRLGNDVPSYRGLSDVKHYRYAIINSTQAGKTAAEIIAADYAHCNGRFS